MVRTTHAQAHFDRRQLCKAALAAAACPMVARADQPSSAHQRLAAYARKRSRSTLRVLAPAGSEANIGAVAKEFTTLSGVDIHVSNVGLRDVGKTALQDHALGENRFDVVLLTTHDLPDLVGARALRPLDDLPLSRTDLRFSGENLYTAGDTFDGTTYGYQTDGDAMVAFFNGAFFDDPSIKGVYEDKYGIAFEIPTSWEQWDQQAQLIHRTIPGTYGFGSMRSRGYLETEFWMRLHGKGIWPLAHDLTPQFNGDVGLEVLDDMKRVAPAVYSPKFNDIRLNWINFNNGKTFATLGFGGTQKILQRLGGVAKNLQFAAPPGASAMGQPKAMSQFTFGWSYTVMMGARDPELAHAFCLFGVTPDVSRIAVGQGGGFFDPFRAEHYDAHSIKAIYGTDFLKVHRASMQSAIPDLYLANRNAYFRTLSDWLARAMDGTVPANEALNRAADDWSLLNITTGKSDQTRRWAALRAKYPPHIAAFLQDRAA